MRAADRDDVDSLGRQVAAATACQRHDGRAVALALDQDDGTGSRETGHAAIFSLDFVRVDGEVTLCHVTEPNGWNV